MITAQRVYQANAQTIKTQDQVLQTIVNLLDEPLDADQGTELRWTGMIYLSMAGAKATLQRQDTLANNLANVSTVGFRAELPAFRAVPVEGSGASTRVYALETTPGYDATPGQVSGDRPQPRRRDERRRLARRAGARRHRGVHARRLARRVGRRPLSRRSGLTVLGDGGPINIPPDSEVSIGDDGTISATAAERPQHDGRPAQAGHAGGAAERGTDGLFRARRRRPAGRRQRAGAGRRARRLERQRRRDDGPDDRRGAPVRGADEAAAHRRGRREGRRAAAVDRLTSPQLLLRADEVIR